MLVVLSVNLFFDFLVFFGNIIDILFLKIESNIDKVDGWLCVFLEYFYSGFWVNDDM